MDSVRKLITDDQCYNIHADRKFKKDNEYISLKNHEYFMVALLVNYIAYL